MTEKKRLQQFSTFAAIIKQKRQGTSWGERDVSAFRIYPGSFYREFGNIQKVL